MELRFPHIEFGVIRICPVFAVLEKTFPLFRNFFRHDGVDAVENNGRKKFSVTEGPFPQVIHRGCGHENSIPVRVLTTFAHIHRPYYYYWI
jgi:hypothetical protein